MEIQPADFIIPLVNADEEVWPFDVELTERSLGQLVELLRGCRFIADSKASGEVSILPDRSRARNLGAFDTPEPVVRYITEMVAGPLCKGDKPPLIVDPACGAGYFLIAALDVLKQNYSNLEPDEILETSLVGMDVDPVAIELSKRNIERHVSQTNGIRLDRKTIDRMLIEVDALSEIDRLPVGMDEADGVIGNPPYQFFSGRGSPVAALQRSGNEKESEKLSRELDLLSERFPATSHGCRDRYKWFINRAVELLHPGGILGFITPNTWIAYPRYRDIRTLLADEGRFISVIDLGAHTFRHAHVPTSIIIWEKGNGGRGKAFPFTRLSKADWQRVESKGAEVLRDLSKHGAGRRINSVGDFVAIRRMRKSKGPDSGLIEFLLNAPGAPHRVRLGDIVTLREGSHAIRAVSVDVSRKPEGRSNYPVIIDKTLGNLVTPETGYIKPPERKPSGIEHHRGERFLIRKTGDRLTVAPSPTGDFALAHQNVYVGKLDSTSIPFLSLVGTLASELMTRLYREGPGGQHHRPLAQLRIAFLKRLPIIVAPLSNADSERPSREDVRNLIDLMRSPRKSRIEPIPRVYPSEQKEIKRTVERIRLFHAAIEFVTSEILAGKGGESGKTLDDLVYHLYGGRASNG